jgi:hypothetical protein
MNQPQKYARYKEQEGKRVIFPKNLSALPQMTIFGGKNGEFCPV